MTVLLHSAALLCVAAAVSAAVLVGAVTRDVRAALPVLLDLLLAAGLLRLAADSSWTALATAAAVVAVRRLAGHGVATGVRPSVTPRRG